MCLYRCLKSVIKFFFWSVCTGFWVGFVPEHLRTYTMLQCNVFFAYYNFPFRRTVLEYPCLCVFKGQNHTFLQYRTKCVKVKIFIESKLYFFSQIHMQYTIFTFSYILESIMGDSLAMDTYVLSVTVCNFIILTSASL